MTTATYDPTPTTPPGRGPRPGLRAGEVADGPIEGTGGRRRSDVRLLVAGPGGLEHRRFVELPDVLAPGDLLVVNGSATLPAAVPVDGQPDRLVHVSGRAADGGWLVELRRRCGAGSVMDDTATAGEALRLPGNGHVRLLTPFGAGGPRPSPRLWNADLRVPGMASRTPQRRSITDPTDRAVVGWLHATGRPIRYGCTDTSWPLDAYQTVFASRPGSAEMPSAARPFTAALLRRLRQRRIGVAPIVLHTGVSSLESDELPYPEWFSVPHGAALRIRRARATGRRIVAVGTTVVRALESAWDDGAVRATRTWTDLVVTPERGVSAVDGLLTGWHEPEATHLDMLEAIAGAELVAASYRAAVEAGYRWHEFGDSHLLLPDGR